MRLVHSLRKAILASALVEHQRAGTASHFARFARPAPPHRQAGLRTSACLIPLRGAPVTLPADAVASMGRSKAKPDNQGKSNTSCYIQVCTLSFLAQLPPCCGGYGLPCTLLQQRRRDMRARHLRTSCYTTHIYRLTFKGQDCTSVDECAAVPARAGARFGHGHGRQRAERAAVL